MTDNESITEEERQVAADQELYLVDGYNNTDDYRYLIILIQSFLKLLIAMNLKKRCFKWWLYDLY